MSGKLYCSAKVFHRVHFVSCGKPATKDGLCGTHQPDAIARRKAAKQARFDAREKLYEESRK